MSTRYLWIRDVDRPADLLGADDRDRPVLSMNFEAFAAAPADNWPRALVKLLETAGLATFGTDCWVGSHAVVQDGAGPFITVVATGGGPTDLYQNGAAYERLSAWVVVRAATYAAAEARALAAWRALKAVTNATIAT